MLGTPGSKAAVEFNLELRQVIRLQAYHRARYDSPNHMDAWKAAMGKCPDGVASWEEKWMKAMWPELEAVWAPAVAAAAAAPGAEAGAAAAAMAGAEPGAEGGAGAEAAARGASKAAAAAKKKAKDIFSRALMQVLSNLR